MRASASGRSAQSLMAEVPGTARRRPAHVVAVCNLKGGTGKSTLSVNLACALALGGLRVALVDNDGQGTAVLWASAGRLPVRCHALPLATLADARPWLRQLAELRAGHDLVLIDFAAGLPPALWPTILMASVILVPTSPSEIEVAATQRMLERVAPLRAARAGGPARLLVVPNRVLGPEEGAQGFRARLLALGEALAPPVRFRPEHDDAFARRLWIGAAHPDSPAHREMAALALQLRAELEGLEPIPWPPRLSPSPAPAQSAPAPSPPPPAPASGHLPLPAPPSPQVVFLDERTEARLRRLRDGWRPPAWAARVMDRLSPWLGLAFVRSAPAPALAGSHTATGPHRTT